jgi:hypothetical protein
MDYLVKTTNFAAAVEHKGRDMNCLCALTKTLFATLAVTAALLSSGSTATAANAASSALAGNPADGFLRDRLLKLGNSPLATTTGTNLCSSSCSPSQALSNTCVSADAPRDAQNRVNITARLSMGKHGFYASLMAQN